MNERKESHGPYDMPQLIRKGLLEYKYAGRPTGRFLRAVIENDLMGAVGRADPESLFRLHDICRWVRWELPESSVGKDAYKKWTMAGGLEGQPREADHAKKQEGADDA
jgi:hypothetical protein